MIENEYHYIYQIGFLWGSNDEIELYKVPNSAWHSVLHRVSIMSDPLKNDPDYREANGLKILRCVGSNYMFIAHSI